jgi:hypothetical protein
VSEPVVVEHGSSPSGRWLRDRRWRLALWIAVIESLIVAIASDVSRWTVLLLAIVAFALYYWVGRRAKQGTFHEATWIFGASQALTLVAVILSFFLSFLAFVVAAILGAAALFYFLFERR